MDRYQKFIQEKAKKKRDLMGSMFFPRTPIIFADFSHLKNAREMRDLLEAFDAIRLNAFVVVPKGKKDLPEGKFLRYFAPDERDHALSAADFAVILDGEVSEIVKNGCVPITYEKEGETKNYNPVQEEGNGFFFKNPTKWEIFAAIVRALETYQFPYDWENLIRAIWAK